MKTLITAFHNEECLLPMWLTHHKKIFNHGILFDHRSTDRSVEIIKDICPTWEIRTIKTHWADPETHAVELTDAQTDLVGWRMYLTPTEFLVGDIDSLFKDNVTPQKFEIPTLSMYDWNPDGNLDLTIPFYKHAHLCKAHWFHARPLFNFYEEFTGGFHSHNPNTNLAFILKYSNCISSPELLKRRLQFQNNYSPECMQTQASWQHHNYGNGITRETLEEYHHRHEYFDVSATIRAYVDLHDEYVKSTVAPGAIEVAESSPALSTNQLKDIVIGTAVGYEQTQIRNFVLSFRTYNKTAKLVFVVDLDTKTKLIDFFNLYAVEPLVFDALKFINSTVHNCRLIGILDYLHNLNLNEYKSILLTDVRDVVFQSDPFINLPEDFLYFFAEDPGITIIEEYWNRRWIETTYGSEILDRIKDRAPICGGTILGSANRILDYVRRAVYELNNARIYKSALFSTEILDQAVCNFIAYCIYNEPNVQIKPNGYIVATLQLSLLEQNKLDQLSIVQDKLLINGGLPAIVHQYDRSSELVQFFNAKYQ